MFFVRLVSSTIDLRNIPITPARWVDTSTPNYLYLRHNRLHPTRSRSTLAPPKSQQLRKTQSQERRRLIMLSQDIFYHLEVVQAAGFRLWALSPGCALVEVQSDATTLTPTALPRKNRVTHSVVKEVVIEDRRPKRAVKNNVALKAMLRPSRSEPVEIKMNRALEVQANKRTGPPSDCAYHHACKHGWW